MFGLKLKLINFHLLEVVSHSTVGGEGSDVSFAALHEAAVVSGRYSVHGSRSFSRISVIELDEPQVGHFNFTLSGPQFD